MMKVRIENVVGSSSFGMELDLPKIAMDLPNSDYAPERFPGLIYRLKDPKTAVLLFHSGKAVCTGGKSGAQDDFALRTIAKMLRASGHRVTAHPLLKIENIVATSNLGAELNLNSTAVTLGLDRVEYEPEQFPGVVCRMEDPRVVLLLFKSGKVVCTGAQRPSDSHRGVVNIAAELRNAGLLQEVRYQTPPARDVAPWEPPSALVRTASVPPGPEIPAES
jgi:transcription initiation factor TFIID TATA-box-binding protein